jgi:hypothetical protein
VATSLLLSLVTSKIHYNPFFIYLTFVATKSCQIVNKWETRFGDLLKCGQKFKFSIEQSVGMEKKELQDLEQSINSTLGFKGIIGFKTAIKSKNGLELKLSASTSEKKEIELAAPECGEWIVDYRQLQQQITITFIDNRTFFGIKSKKGLGSDNY